MRVKVFVFWCFIVIPIAVYSQDSTKTTPRIGGIEQVGNRIEHDDAEKTIRIEPWKDLTLVEAKNQLYRLTGLSLKKKRNYIISTRLLSVYCWVIRILNIVYCLSSKNDWNKNLLKISLDEAD